MLEPLGGVAELSFNFEFSFRIRSYLTCVN